ncbi:hypothetical protein ACFP1I_14690 [Dyadobacter subterraneus]|uniref:Glycosyltransferase RgtA/B/C/D-like domain-containing protein n=1 Tax=Dyadobacter subterraneus TaxID=2773304 RepID=A0ABR9WBX7_9BACT|nr:hypothetical protein [Dyadobacter subterraneus]MBE9462989.1 hypothetical protein [Dyadobacter subterraneus]
MEEAESNIDTSTWLSAVYTVNHYPEWIWTLLNYTDSRPLTVLPLIFVSKLGINVGYIVSECVGLVFWLTTTFLLYKIFDFFLSKQVSLILIWGFCLLIGTTFVSDYTAYNSEQLSVLLLTACTYAYLTYSYDQWKSSWGILFFGFAMGSLVYVKFQNVPMGIFISIALFIEVLVKKRYKSALILISGALILTIFINLYYYSKGSLMIFWNNYFWNYFYYAYTTQFSDVPISDRFNLVRIFRFIYFYDDSKWYYLSITIVAIVGIIANVVKRQPTTARQKQIFFFSLLYIFVSLYAVLQSGNSFAHYKLYLWVPVTLFTGIIIALSPTKIQKYCLIFFIISSAFIAGKNLLNKEKNLLADHSDLDQKIIASIRRNSRSGEPVVVWGWRDQLYVRAQRPMGYRDAHSFHFALKSRLIPYWTIDFLHDIRKNKPSVFIDVTQPEGYSTFAKILSPHYNIPQIREYINKYYSLIENIEGVRIYKLKN